MTIIHEIVPKTVVVEEEVAIICHCDICDKTINDEEKYFEVMTGHHAWGADSGDSIRYQQLCSADCVAKSFEKYQDEFNEYPSAYFEVRQEVMKLEDFDE